MGEYLREWRDGRLGGKNGRREREGKGRVSTGGFTAAPPLCTCPWSHEDRHNRKLSTEGFFYPRIAPSDLPHAVLRPSLRSHPR